MQIKTPRSAGYILVVYLFIVLLPEMKAILTLPFGFVFTVFGGAPVYRDGLCNVRSFLTFPDFLPFAMSVLFLVFRYISIYKFYVNPVVNFGDAHSASQRTSSKSTTGSIYCNFTLKKGQKCEIIV